MIQSATGIAPGKIILSGEHAVVKGAPALAMAIDRFMTTHVVAAEHPPFKQLDFIKTSLELRYHAFLKKSLSIEQVIEKPEALVAYAVAQLQGYFDPNHQQPGFALSTQTNLPVGCGMGSSAALILSIYKGLEAAFGFEIPEAPLKELAIEAENLVHGKSSGLDIFTCLKGGLNRFEKKTLTPIPCQTFSVDLIHSGKPESSTGECVVQAGLYLTDSKVEAFAKVTQKIQDAITKEDPALLWNGIRENHRLLSELGVVPNRVKRLIADIESQGGAAKICGAGSVRGENAGVIWVFGLDEGKYQSLSKHYHADFMGAVFLCPQGAQACQF